MGSSWQVFMCEDRLPEEVLRAGWVVRDGNSYTILARLLPVPTIRSNASMASNDLLTAKTEMSDKMLLAASAGDGGRAFRRSKMRHKCKRVNDMRRFATFCDPPPRGKPRVLALTARRRLTLPE